MQLRKYMTVRRLCIGGAIAGLYAVLTFALQPLSYGVVQFRISEAMTVLPVFFPEAIPGLFIGCVLANLLGGFGIYDIVFGSLATLVAALLTWKLRKSPLPVALLPPVLVNALVIGVMLHFLLNENLWLAMGSVGLGQLGACYALGIPLAIVLKRLLKKQIL